MILLQYKERTETRNSRNLALKIAFPVLIIFIAFFSGDMKEYLGIWVVAVYALIFLIINMFLQREDNIVFSIEKIGDELLISRAGKEQRKVKESNVTDLSIHKALFGRQIIEIKEGTYQLVYKYTLNRDARQTINRLHSEEYRLSKLV